MTIHWIAVEQYFNVVLFVNPLTPKVKPWVIQSFLTFDSMDRTLKCGQFYPVCYFGKFISFGIGTVRGERVKRRSLYNEGNSKNYTTFVPETLQCLNNHVQVRKNVLTNSSSSFSSLIPRKTPSSIFLTCFQFSQEKQRTTKTRICVPCA